MGRTRIYLGLAVAFALFGAVLYLAAPKFNPNDNTTRDLHMYGTGASAIAAVGFAIGAWARRNKGLS